MTAEFGISHAGKAWLRRIEPLTATQPDPALIPARRIARQTSSPAAITGHVVAVTIGERGHQHEVKLTVPTWGEAEATTVSELLARTPLAPLEDLPDGLLGDLRAAQVDLAPALDQIQVHPPTAHRRHVLAAFYKLIQLLDEDPPLALALRQPQPETVHPTATSPGWLPLADLDADSFYTKS